MRPYLTVFHARFRSLLQYRAAAAAGVACQFFWGLIRVMIFAAFYRSTTAAQPMSLEQVISYVWLSQALFALLPWGVDNDIAAAIRSGNVAYELLRPVDLHGYWLSRCVAQRLAPTLLRCGPIFAVALLFAGLQPPASVASAAAWAAATAGAVALGCALSVLVTLTLLWTIAGEGVARLVPALAYLCSGLVIPLPLLPDGLRQVLEALPFAGLIDLPFRLWTGHIPPGEVWGVLAHQLAWAATLILIGRWLLARGIRRLVVQGG